jgi:hypothetical protein
LETSDFYDSNSFVYLDLPIFIKYVGVSGKKGKMLIGRKVVDSSFQEEKNYFIGKIIAILHSHIFTQVLFMLK